MFIEITAAILGLIQGVLVMLNRKSNWIFYILQMGFLLLFSLVNKLYGDVVNNAIYLVFGIAGLIRWNKPEKDSDITTAGPVEKAVYAAIIAAGTIAGAYLLSGTDDPLPLLDAFTTVSSLAATYYMVRRKLDTWIIWFIIDIFYALEYFILPDQALCLFALNCIWTVMAVVSYVNWRRIMKEAAK